MTGGTIIAGSRYLDRAVFWAGVLAVVAGVCLHLPAFAVFSRWTAAFGCAAGACHMGMAGDMDASAGMTVMPMRMDGAMVAGMALIVGGVVAAGYGLFAHAGRRAAVSAGETAFGATFGGPMTRAHWELVGVLIIAVVIDVMKPATLGFVMPGMVRDYGLARSEVALLPFVALSGTAAGSLVWGLLADRVGRRATILFAAIMFVGTSICGAMPNFRWNLVMCFMMGLPAGGMLPIAFTLLSEIAPAGRRGWLLVLLGGTALAGGYLAASTAATLLEPAYGWRLLWLLGVPTGLALIALNGRIPESPTFLLLHDRGAEAERVIARYGLVALPVADGAAAPAARRVFAGRLLPQSLALNGMAVVWGLINFGLLLWMPTNLQASGLRVAQANALLATSSLWALPVALAAAAAYRRWGGKPLLIVLGFVTAAGLLALGAPGAVERWAGITPIETIALIMIGSNGIIAVLLPYTVESYPSGIRGQATGLVAGSSKVGGIGAQVVSLAGAVPGLAPAALILALPITAAAVIVARYGRGSDTARRPAATGALAALP